MKTQMHYIDRDLDAMKGEYGWYCLDVVDEHWFWLWETARG